MSRLETIARAINPAAWAGRIWTHDGEDVTVAHRRHARASARRVLAALEAQAAA